MACDSPVKYIGVPDYEKELELFQGFLATKDHRMTAFRFLAQYITNVFSSILPVKANYFDPIDKSTWPLWVASEIDPLPRDGDRVDMIAYYKLRGIPDTIPGMVYERRTKENLIWSAILAVVGKPGLELQLLSTVTDNLQFTDPSIYPLSIGIGMDAYLNQVRFVIVDKITNEVLFKYSAVQDCFRIPLTVYDPDQPPVFANIDECGNYIYGPNGEVQTLDPTGVPVSITSLLRPQVSDYNYVIGTSEAAPSTPGCSGRYHISYMIGCDTVDFALEQNTCNIDFVLPHAINVRHMLENEPVSLIPEIAARLLPLLAHFGEEGPSPAYRRDGPVEYIRCRGCDPSAKRADYCAPCGCDYRGDSKHGGQRILSGGCGGRR